MTEEQLQKAKEAYRAVSDGERRIGRLKEAAAAPEAAFDRIFPGDIPPAALSAFLLCMAELAETELKEAREAFAAL